MIIGKKITNKDIRLGPLPELYALGIGGQTVQFNAFNDENGDKNCGVTYTHDMDNIATLIHRTLSPRQGKFYKRKDITVFFTGDRKDLAGRTEAILDEVAIQITNSNNPNFCTGYWDWYNQEGAKYKDAWILDYVLVDEDDWDNDDESSCSAKTDFRKLLAKIRKQGIKLTADVDLGLALFHSSEDCNFARLTVKEIADQDYINLYSIADFHVDIQKYKAYVKNIVKFEHYLDYRKDNG